MAMDSIDVPARGYWISIGVNTCRVFGEKETRSILLKYTKMQLKTLMLLAQWGKECMKSNSHRHWKSTKHNGAINLHDSMFISI